MVLVFPCRFGARLFDLPLPGCESFEVTSEAYWECYIRHLTFTIYHYCGTAKMGPYWDPNAVVDPKLRSGAALLKPA